MKENENKKCSYESATAGYEGIREAGEILKQGGSVAFPTETVYGLGGNGLDPQASAKIYQAKGAGFG